MLQRNHYSFLFITLTTLTLNACAPYKPTDQRAAVCNELNKKMIFTGSTSNPRGAEIQTAEYDLLQKQYESNNCDG